jgi:hypothetical protein
MSELEPLEMEPIWIGGDTRARDRARLLTQHVIQLVEMVEAQTRLIDDLRERVTLLEGGSL